MALVNPNIAMSYRGIEVPQQNALADYATIQQIQGGRQTQELNALKMQEAQRTAKSQNMLADAYAQATDPATGKIDYNKLTGLVAAGGGGAQIPGIQKSRFEQETANTKLLSDRLALLPNAYKMADTPEAYLALHQSLHADPVVGPWLKSVGATPEKGLATLQNAIQTGKFDDLRLKSMQSVAQLLEGMKPITVSPGASVFQGGKSVFTAPAAPPAPTDIAKLIKERDALPKGSPDRLLYDREIADRNATAENARQRLRFDQAKFNWEKANPGFEIREADDGSVVGVNKRTLQAFPVTIGGAAAPAAGGAGMPSARVPAAATQAPVAGGTPLRGKGQGMTEGERKASTLLQRLQFSENQLTKALVDDPNAAKPGVFTSALDVLSTPLANTLTPEARQRVQSAQLDILDAALTLGTGAAYTKEQLEGYRSSYFPAIGDGPTQVKDKKARLQNVISAAKIAAGKGAKLVPDASSGANANDPLGLLGGK
jgi:hypothetical protein